MTCYPHLTFALTRSTRPICQYTCHRTSQSGSRTSSFRKCIFVQQQRTKRTLEAEQIPPFLPPEMTTADEFRLASPSISHDGRLPRKYTGEGQGAQRNISPPLEWYNVPEGTKTLALVVQDIDAPHSSGLIVPWTHWVVVNIPATTKGLPEGFSGKGEEWGGEYAGVKEGNNDWKVPGWRVPCLPSNSPHRLEFKVYALDFEVNLGNKVTKEKVLEFIEGHVVGEAVLTAIF